MCIRVLIADDQPRARRSLKALLTAMCWSTPGHAEQSTSAGHLSIKVVGEANTGQEMLEQVEAFHPNVVVMDWQPHTAFALEPRLDGAATIQMIKSRWPAIRIVVLTMYATDRASVLAAGADAFLLKGCAAQDLLDAVVAGPAGSADAAGKRRV